MNKPAFDPNQPFEGSKPAFDPNQPFDASPQMGGSAPIGVLAQALYKRTPMGIVNNALIDDPAQVLPIAGAVAGSALGPLGTAAGAGAGQIAKRMVDIGTGRVEPADAMNPGREAIAPMAQTALGGLPEVGGVKDAIQGAAKTFGRRALGFTKPMMKRVNFGVDEANDVAQTMLDKDVIKFGSGTKATLERARDLRQEAGESIGKGLSALDSVGAKSFDPKVIADKVYADLKPSYSGGAYENAERIAQEIKDTIMAHGKGPTSFKSAQDLKEILQKLGKFNNSTDGLRAEMYRKASSSVRQALEDSVDAAAHGKELAIPGQPQGPKISPDILDRYMASKKLYGQSETAIGALEDRQAGEASNNLISLRGAAAGASAMATGNPAHALEALGVWEALRRRGESSAATALNYLNNSGSTARQAAMSAFVNKVASHGSAPRSIPTEEHPDQIKATQAKRSPGIRVTIGDRTEY